MLLLKARINIYVLLVYQVPRMMALYPHYITESLKQPIFQMKKLSLRERKWFAASYIAGNWQTRLETQKACSFNFAIISSTLNDGQKQTVNILNIYILKVHILFKCDKFEKRFSY